MLVTGPAVAPGTTVTWADARAITISTGLPADLPSGSALPVAPTATPSTPQTACSSTSSSTCRLSRRCRRRGSGSRCRRSSCSSSGSFTNLEPEVSSVDIDASRWEWMKRYRVWEANRQVFLWPEDWYVPGTARRPVTVLPADDEHPAAGRHHRRRRPPAPTWTTSPASKRSRSSSPAACTTSRAART